MKVRGTIIGFAAILMWAVLALLTAASAPIPPLELAAMTFVIGGLLGGLRFLAEPGRLKTLHQNWRVWFTGIGGLFGYHLAYFTAMRHAPPVEVSLIAYLWPLFMVIFSCLLPGERLKLHHVAGVLLGLAGAFLVITDGRAFAFGNVTVLGHGLALACAFIWSGYSTLSRRLGHVPTDVVSGFCLATSALALLFHLMLETTVWPETAVQWLAVLSLGVFPVGLAFYAWDYGVKRGDIMIIGALAYFSPLLSTLVLVAAGYASLTRSVAIACLLITAGALVAAKDMLGRRGPAAKRHDGRI